MFKFAPLGIKSTLIAATLALSAFSLNAQAETADPEKPSVNVFGVTKNAYFRQTNESTISYTKSGIYSFVEGTGISSTFPSQPVVMTVPSGITYTLGLSGSMSDPSLRFDQFEDSFASQAALDALFPDGSYSFRSGNNNNQLNLVGTYSPAPIVQFSNGKWQGGQLILSADQAATDLRITSSFTNANGFRSIAINDDLFSYKYFTYEDGSSPGIVSALIPGGSLKLGQSYYVEVEFDNTADSINPTAGELRNGFALYSTTTFLTVSVVPETDSVAMLLVGLGLVGGVVRRRQAKTA